MMASGSPNTLAELKALKTVAALRQRAESVGVPTQQIEDARDADDPKSALIALITASAGPSALRALPALNAMTVGALRQRAKSVGVPAE
eukprot:COSAG01_NODE_59233_length_301_cov_1.019802_1_plen_88_part_01